MLRDLPQTFALLRSGFRVDSTIISGRPAICQSSGCCCTFRPNRTFVEGRRIGVRAIALAARSMSVIVARQGSTFPCARGAFYYSAAAFAGSIPAIAQLVERRFRNSKAALANIVRNHRKSHVFAE